MGPSAIAVHPTSGHLFVSRLDFKSESEFGLISIINEGGTLEKEVYIPEIAEITGLSFSKVNEDYLYITENSKYSLAKVKITV